MAARKKVDGAAAILMEHLWGHLAHSPPLRKYDPPTKCPCSTARWTPGGTPPLPRGARTWPTTERALTMAHGRGGGHQGASANVERAS